MKGILTYRSKNGGTFLRDIEYGVSLREIEEMFIPILQTVIEEGPGTLTIRLEIGEDDGKSNNSSKETQNEKTR